MAPRKTCSDAQLARHLAETGNVAKTAKKLKLTPAAVYKRIRDNEELRTALDEGRRAEDERFLERLRDPNAALDVIKALLKKSGPQDSVRAGVAYRCIDWALKVRELEAMTNAGAQGWEIPPFPVQRGTAQAAPPSTEPASGAVPSAPAPPKGTG